MSVLPNVVLALPVNVWGVVPDMSFDVVDEREGQEATLLTVRTVDEMASVAPGCENRGRPSRKIVAHGSFATKSRRRQRFRCKVCGRMFSTGVAPERCPSRSAAALFAAEPTEGRVINSERCKHPTSGRSTR